MNDYILQPGIDLYVIPSDTHTHIHCGHSKSICYKQVDICYMHVKCEPHTHTHWMIECFSYSRVNSHSQVAFIHVISNKQNKILLVQELNVVLFVGLLLVGYGSIGRFRDCTTDCTTLDTIAYCSSFIFILLVTQSHLWFYFRCFF